MTKRSASTMLDLPQPFGPTTPVMPGWIGISMASAKDLNPCRRSRVTFIGARLPAPAARRPWNSLEQRLDLLVQILKRQRPFELLAVDEERRRGLHTKCRRRASLTSSIALNSA